MEKRFISASAKRCTLAEHQPEYYMRKTFSLETVGDAKLKVSGLGFYLLFINGKDITKGLLAPYISNPDDVCYYDVYDIAPYLSKGKNVIGLILGNGKQNPIGEYVWDGDRATWASCPKAAFELTVTENGNERLLLSADETVKVHECPIRFDDERYGEYYDANFEIPDWCNPSFDDSNWQNAILAEPPAGELRECRAEPIKTIGVRKPVNIIKSNKGFIYDFGINSAGLCKLTLKNPVKGQTVTLRYTEQIRDSELYFEGCCFPVERFPEHPLFNQRDVYIARGDGEETWIPHFTYHGFRYAEVIGVTPEQADENLLQYFIMSSDLATHGGFCCSDETVNTLFRMTQNADRSNFYYFPTDCPHREKNGWTGDAAISCFQMMMLYDCEASFEEWMTNIRRAQRDGVIPGVVPTVSFGYTWGNGPAWDRAAFYIPYEVARLRGNKNIIVENAEMMFSYLKYLETRREKNGTIAYGLGDWASVGRRYSRFETPLAVSDSILAMDIARKAAEMFSLINDEEKAAFAAAFAEDMRKTIRRELLNPYTATLRGRTQTGQAMGLFYGVFEKEEEAKAFGVLLDLIHEKNDSFDCGILGLETIFHVLSRFGESELAFRMITKREFPSYRYLIDTGETSLIERFMPRESPVDSHNHHFMGDIVRWFIKEIAGLRVEDSKTVEIRPASISAISSAEAFYEMPAGRVFVNWKREDGRIKLSYGAPHGVEVKLHFPDSELYEVIEAPAERTTP